MTQVTDSSQNAVSPNGLKPTTAVPNSNKDIPKAVEAPPAPPPKSKSHRWTWLIVGTVAIAAIGAGSYWLLRPQNNDVIAFSGRIEGYETDVSTQGTGKVEFVTVREKSQCQKRRAIGTPR